MSFLIDCLITQIREYDDYEDPHARELIFGYFCELEGDKVFVAEKSGELAGMVLCGVCNPAPWDLRLSGAIWMLFVKPEHRHDVAVVNQLLYHANRYLTEQNVTVFSICARDERLMERYKSLFEMRVVEHEYSMTT